MGNLAVYFAGAFIGLVLILNIIATYIVFNTYFEVKNRRIYQTLFIWLVPFIGPILAIYFNRENYFEQKHKKQIGNQTAFTDTDGRIQYIAGHHRGGR